MYMYYVVNLVIAGCGHFKVTSIPPLDKVNLNPAHKQHKLSYSINMSSALPFWSHVYVSTPPDAATPNGPMYRWVLKV